MDKIQTARRTGGLFNSVYFIAFWFATSSTALIFSLIFAFYLSSSKFVSVSTKNQSFKLYAALPEVPNSISDEIDHADGRSKIIENFFKSYKAPLFAYSSHFIQVADKYDLDWRLLPSISMQESSGGKKIIKNSFNPFGYGIYGNLVTRFNSWEEAIERVGKALREDYINQGLKTPYQIMTKYTPPSLAKGGPWAAGVTTFMEELR